MAEFRIYNKLDCNLFDLIGHKEPDQTKGLGLLLAKSDLYRNEFLKLVGTSLQYDQCIVDCELIFWNNSKQKCRADIVLRFYNTQKQPISAIIIEAKGLNNNHTSNQTVASQVSNYTPTSILLPFGLNVKTIILTNVKCCDSASTSITWMEIRELLYTTLGNKKISNGERSLMQDYLKYINKVQNIMKFYNEEVMSIPAGTSYNLVKNYGIYECPINGKHYQARANAKPLYVAFRQKGGKVTELFKVKDIIELDIRDYGNNTYVDPAISPLLNSLDIVNINGYFNQQSNIPPATGPSNKKYVFILEKNCINATKGPSFPKIRVHKFHKLSDFLV
jgi:hypothetical protein